MTMSAIAPVLARIASIESMIGVGRRPAIAASSHTGAPAASFAETLADVEAHSTDDVDGGRAAPGADAATHTAAADATDARLAADHAGGHSHDHAHDHAHGEDAYVVVERQAYALAVSSLGDQFVPAPAPAGASTVQGAVPPGTPFGIHFETAAARHGVPADLLAAVGWVESRYQPEVVSPAGAIGVMQLMPFVADELGVDPADPVAAIDGGARLLAAHHDRFGSWDLALAAYFSGAGAVSRAGNNIPTARSEEYVRRVHERLEQA
ncbi:MAG: lytic transglycosylase domain-containing protein [Ilumatobacter sp.]|uniref:transglycosylase SLT domain-containing protein n=1 Tax=Ilumatobacter sp. TaxID=1967498 RepID=UPI00261CC126|nr:lytic transglycosylase domain-containing protein [Ilumatobacter sp.]MDJ0767461.1 lytic transglycosylase domain-containing protein [Ilumatobacter sp.]